jgi:hypothetical protein
MWYFRFRRPVQTVQLSLQLPARNGFAMETTRAVVSLEVQTWGP